MSRRPDLTVCEMSFFSVFRHGHTVARHSHSHVIFRSCEMSFFSVFRHGHAVARHSHLVFFDACLRWIHVERGRAAAAKINASRLHGF